MRYSTVVSSALLAAGQTAFAAVFDVTVGGATLTYTPSTVNAAPGDTVRFTFQQKNHTVTQSTFAAPCLPMANGFDTGFQPVAANQTGSFPVAQVSITSSDPVWIFCRQANHCQQGMVFAINPGTKFDAFKAAAASNPFGNNTSTSSSTSTAPASTGTAPSTSTTAAPPTSTTGSGTGTGTDHRIIVGGTNIIAFNPPNITAAVGDTITFEFHQKNHTITQSAFDTPCRALASTSTTGQIGFDSGFMPVADNVTSSFPTFTITVNNTNPIWGYCRQTGHCGQGMVFAANAVESGPKNFSAFQALAKQQNGTAPTGNNSGAASAHAQSYAPALAAAFAALALFA